MFDHVQNIVNTHFYLCDNISLIESYQYPICPQSFIFILFLLDFLMKLQHRLMPYVRDSLLIGLDGHVFILIKLTTLCKNSQGFSHAVLKELSIFFRPSIEIKSA